ERWDRVDYRRPLVLVLGGEGRGMRRLVGGRGDPLVSLPALRHLGALLVRERCDPLVSLPLFGHVGSLNVSVAAGIALYEVIRQRGAVPSQVRPIPIHPQAAGGHRPGPAT